MWVCTGVCETETLTVWKMNKKNWEKRIGEKSREKKKKVKWKRKLEASEKDRKREIARKRGREK